MAKRLQVSFRITEDEFARHNAKLCAEIAKAIERGDRVPTFSSLAYRIFREHLPAPAKFPGDKWAADAIKLIAARCEKAIDDGAPIMVKKNPPKRKAKK